MLPRISNNYTDEECIKHVKNGEIEYYNAIISRHVSRITSFIAKITFEKNDVPDIVQNSFLKLYKSLDRFDETRPLLPYLYEIARNEFRMYVRSKKHTSSLSDEISVENADPTQLETNKFTIDQALSSVSPVEGNLLLLLGKGFTYAEIAEKVKKPVNTVKTLVRRARLKIQHLFNEHQK